MGRPPVYAEPGRATAIRLPSELHDRLRQAAAARQVSANLLVEHAIAEYLDRYGSHRSTRSAVTS